MAEVVDCFEEVFDDARDMQEIDEIAWKKLKEARLKDGFADGMHLGEESTLQNGFDHGFYEGFQLSYSLSIIQGLLAVAEMQIVPSDSTVKKRFRELKSKLDMFRKNVTSFKLSCLHGEKAVDNDDEFQDCSDENSNSLDVVSPKENPSACYFSSLNAEDVFERNKDKVTLICQELDKIKEEISSILNDCNQPTIMDQISMSM